MKQNHFSITNRLKSFGFAFNGLKILLKEEHNARIHIVVAILVVVLGFMLKLNSTEWLALVFAIGFVFVTEIVNTCIENLADFVSPEWHAHIKKIKDLAAAAVLVSVFTAVIVGLIIFIPKMLD